MRMRNKIGYAIGDVGISIAYFAVGFFFIYYLTDIVGLDPVLAGLAFFLGKLWDGINDPIMGVLSDRTRSRYGRKRVYVIYGAFPLAISFILLWMIPVDASQWTQFILATVSLTLFATAYTVVVVPYMALVPVMSADYDERTQITGLRAALSTVGTILGGGAALLLSNFTDAVLGLRTITTGFAMITLFALLIAGYSVRGLEDNPDADDEIVPFQSAPLYFSREGEKCHHLAFPEILGRDRDRGSGCCAPLFRQTYTRRSSKEYHWSGNLRYCLSLDHTCMEQAHPSP